MDRGLVDLSGLSGDPESDDRAEKILARLEAEIKNPPGMRSVQYSQQPSIIRKNRRSRARLFDPRAQRQHAWDWGDCSYSAHYKRRPR